MEHHTLDLANLTIQTYWVAVCNSLDLVIIFTASKSDQSIRIEFPTCWVELFTVIHTQLCPKRVDGNDKCTTIRFKLHRDKVIELLREVPQLYILTCKICDITSAVVPPSF